MQIKPKLVSFFKTFIILSIVSLVSKLTAEAVVQGCSIKKVFLENSRHLQKNTCTRVSFLLKFIKKRLWQRYFPVNFVKYLKIPYLFKKVIRRECLLKLILIYLFLASSQLLFFVTIKL